MNPTSPDSAHQELIERGKLTLQAILYQEQAARFKAEAAALQAALVKAENGDADQLRSWLEFKSSPSALTALDSRSAPNNLTQPTPNIARVESTHLLPSPRLPLPSQSQPICSPSGVANQKDDVPFDSHANVSPWEKMERAAKDRIALARQSSGDLLEHVENDELDPYGQYPASQQDETYEYNLAKDLDARTNDIDPLEPSSDGPMDSWDSLSETTDSHTHESGDVSNEPFPNEIFSNLSDVDATAESVGKKAWWRATHVWVSLTVHALVVIALSVVVMSVAAKPQIVSIVAATVEADNVLMETPMEMISELETSSETPMENSFAGTSPDTSGLASEMSLPTLPTGTGMIPSTPAASSSGIGGAGQGDMQGAMSGSKMVAGAEFFGVKATGNTFVYIVDSSPSMKRDGAFEAARQEIIRSLSSMKPKQRYLISFFGKEIDPMVFKSGNEEKYPINATPENLQLTLDWLSRVQIQKEGLPPNDALAKAIALQPDGIFLLFDGDTKVDVAKFLRRANRSDDFLSAGNPKVPIHVVHFFQDEFQKQMKQVAEENGGTYRFVPRPERTTKGKR
jgi:hypothetical protein